MTGWQDKVSVDERRCAALLSVLVNSRRPVPVAEILVEVPEYPVDPAEAIGRLDADTALLRSYGLDVVRSGGEADSVAIGLASWQHRPVELGEDDKRLLEQAVAIAGPLEAPVEAALAAIRGETLPLESDTTISLSPPGSAARGRPVAYSRLHRLSWLAGRGVTAGFGYRDANGEFVPRTLQVAGLGESRGVWYAVGYEPGSKTMRAFAVSEMRGPVTEVDAAGSYLLPPGMDVSEYLALSWRSGPDPLPVRVWFDAEIAPFMSSMLVHLPLESQPDGSLEATMTVGDLEDFVGWVLSFGTHARVTAPDEVVRRTREVLETAVARHG